MEVRKEEKTRKEKSKKEVVRNILFSEGEMELLSFYADRLSLPPGTALKMLVCTEVDNFIKNNRNEITLHFGMKPRKKAADTSRYVACRISEDIYQTISGICRIVGMKQSAFIKYLVIPILEDTARTCGKEQKWSEI